MRLALGPSFNDPRDHKGNQDDGGKFVSLKKETQADVPKNMWTIPFLLYDTSMFWTCICFHLCHTGIVEDFHSIAFGKRLKAYGRTQYQQKSQGYVYECPNPNPSPNPCTIHCSNPLPLSNPRSFVLACRIMKLIIAEQGNNAWLAHGTPHLNVRSDFVETETGIKRKETFG
jgi:hypothetical protein